MRKWFIILMMAILFIFPSLAFAQNQVVIETLDVNFWPEYDRADMLVLNYVTLAPGVALPVTFDMRIPATAGAPAVVAVGLTLDSVSDVDAKYTTKQEGDWLIVSVEMTGPALQLEYYDAGLKKDGAARSYSYEWLSKYDVKKIAVTLQRPFDASAFKSSLALQDAAIHPNDGLQYLSSNGGAVNANKPFSFDLSYNKPSDTFSVSQLKVEPVDPVNVDTPGRMSFSNYLPYIVGGVGFLLIAGGAVYYFQINNTSAKKPRRRSRATDSDEGGDTYCSQCGARARGGDRFCRTCGSRIKQED